MNQIILRRYLLLVMILCLLLPFALAQSNDSTNESSENQTMVTNTSELNVLENSTTQGEEENGENQSISVPLVTDFTMVGLSSSTNSTGDAVLRIEISNTGTAPIEDLVPIIVARGFSTYDVAPLPFVAPGEKGTAIVTGSFSIPGDIVVTVKVGDKVFYDTISLSDTKKREEEKARELEEAQTKEALKVLQGQFEILKKATKEAETQYEEKKDSYLLNEVSFTSLKKYIAETQSHLLSSEAKLANISLALAREELNDVTEKLTTAQKRPFTQTLRDNLLPISGIAAAFMTIYSLYELIKSKHGGNGNGKKEEEPVGSE